MTNEAGKCTTTALVAVTLGLAALSPVTAAADRQDNTKNDETTMKTSTAQLESAPPSAADAIRPFQVNFPDAALVELRRRIAATQWPEKETVADSRRACRSRRCRNSRAIGRPTTTGERWRRS